ncbi:Mediator of RNA polymerase II transcription subunit 30 [Halotydeus destructor]|nr:Mediator of RNA polymerase II transcription subunit 30 [Halotydeus destructor]
MNPNSNQGVGHAMGQPTGYGMSNSFEQMQPNMPGQPAMNSQQQPRQQGHMQHGQQMMPGMGNQPRFSMQPAPQRENINPTQFCKIGQEIVQEIVSKTSEMFKCLKALPPPNGSQISISRQDESKRNLHETIVSIVQLFKELRKISEKCCEATSEMEYVQLESLVPLRDELPKSLNQDNDKKNADLVRHLDEEKKVLTDQLRLRNKQLKEVIDKLREVVWEINTMLAMRKP